MDLDYVWWATVLFYYGLLPSAIMTLVSKQVRKMLDAHWGHANVDHVNARGKIVLITGAGSGVGFSTAVSLLNRGATVIITGRMRKKAAKTVIKLRHQTFLGTLIPMKLELSSLDSVRKFCEEVRNRFDKLDILINNAGVLVPAAKGEKSLDGLEIHFAVNHLSHFLMTSLLFPLLANAKDSRVVVLSSLAHRGFTMNTEDLQLEKTEIKETLSQNPLYQNSKFANLLFARELRRRVKQKAELKNIRVYACCPGIVKTNISRNLNLPWYSDMLMPMVGVLFKTPEQGAETVVKCALLENYPDDEGILHRHCSPWSPTDRSIPDDWFQSTEKHSYSVEDARKLWSESERLCGEDFNI